MALLLGCSAHDLTSVHALLGLEVPGLEAALECLLTLAMAVHVRCADASKALLDMLDAGVYQMQNLPTDPSHTSCAKVAMSTRWWLVDS